MRSIRGYISIAHSPVIVRGLPLSSPVPIPEADSLCAGSLPKGIRDAHHLSHRKPKAAFELSYTT